MTAAEWDDDPDLYAELRAEAQEQMGEQPYWDALYGDEPEESR